MIKKKVKNRKRINPEIDIEEILENLKPYENNIKINYIGRGNFGETYIFSIKFDKVLDSGEILKSGKYLIKRFIIKSTREEINRLIKLSKYGLIPKIYFISKNYMIMKYINSFTLKNLIENNQLSILQIRLIFNQIRNLIKNWHALGFYHGDLDSLSNILITENKKIYLIDPCLYFDSFGNEIELELNRDLEMLKDRENFIINQLKRKLK